MNQDQIQLLKAILPESAHEKITEETTIENVASLMPEFYVEKDFAQAQIKTEIGKRMGALETKLRRLIGEDGKGKNVDDLLPLVESRYEELRQELSSAKASGADTQQLTEELNQLKKDRDVFKELSEKAGKEISEWQQKAEAAENKILTIREQVELDNSVNAFWSNINWVDGASDYLKTGIWKSEVEGKVTFKKEGAKVIVYDTDGNMLTNGTGAMYADAFFNQLAEKAGALKKNGAAPTPPNGSTPTRFERMTAKRTTEQSKLINKIISGGN